MNTAKSRKTLLIKCAIGASAILLLLWLLFPNERYQQLSGSQSNTGVAEQQQQQQQRPSAEHQGSTGKKKKKSSSFLAGYTMICLV